MPFSLSRTPLIIYWVLCLCSALVIGGCARALPTKDEQSGINQALLKTQEQAGLAKQYAERAVLQRQEAERLLAQAKVYFESAMKVQEICRKRPPPVKCPILKAPESEPKSSQKELPPKAVEVVKEVIPERHAESAVTRQPEEPVQPTLDPSDLDYSPSDAPPGLYEKLNKSGK
jgi:hypothetical protein